jgi:glutaminyl-tRNA synthetase
MTDESKPSNFIREIILEHNRSGRFGARSSRAFRRSRTATCTSATPRRLSIDFGMAREFGGRCNLRFDDTNPTKESQEYVDAIMRDIRWLGFDWGEHLYHASDYFEQLYQWAEQLIRAGKAYVDDLTGDQIREYRGTLTEPGRPSPIGTARWRRTWTSSAACGQASSTTAPRPCARRSTWPRPTSTCAIPVMYRIRKATHQRTGDTWCIYPLYDWAHGAVGFDRGRHALDVLARVRGSPPALRLVLDALGIFHPQQIEFARLNVSHTVLSKRKLLQLVESGQVRGWDDPRMPTLAGLRRRGYTPEALRDFAERVGVTKSPMVAELAYMEHCLREDLNKRAERRLAVLRR